MGLLGSGTLHCSCHCEELRAHLDVPLVGFMYPVFTSGGVYVPCIYLWWSLYTLYLHLVEFMYLVFISGGVYVPCIYTQCEVRVTVGDSGLCCCTSLCYVFRALITSPV